jgi:hypothetical protein
VAVNSPSPVPANDGGAGLSLGGARRALWLLITLPLGERIKVRGAVDLWPSLSMAMSEFGGGRFCSR